MTDCYRGRVRDVTAFRKWHRRGRLWHRHGDDFAVRPLVQPDLQRRVLRDGASGESNSCRIPRISLVDPGTTLAPKMPDLVTKRREIEQILRVPTGLRSG